MMNGIPVFVLVIGFVAVLFGGIPWLLGWIQHPGRNLLILLACLASLGLWMLYRWWRF